MSDESQKRTDEQYRLHELREGARRFADLGEPVGVWVGSRIVDSRTTAHTYYFPPDRPLLTPDNWEGWLAKREEIEREEKRAFNEKYGYAQ